MSVFFDSVNLSVSGGIDVDLKHPNELMESFIIDELSFLSPEQLQEFCEPGGVADQLVTEGKLRSKNTIVKMSKKDDYSRRVAMTCMQLAKDNNDPNWKKLVKAQQMKNKYKAAIVKRWSNQAERVAKKSQNEFLHGGPKKKGVLPDKFRKYHGDDMRSQND